MSDSATVLISAKDEAIADLLEALVGLAGLKAVLPDRNARVVHAIARHRPALVLLDCSDDDPHRDCPHASEYCLAAEIGTTVILFSALLNHSEVEWLAAQRHPPAVTFPVSHRDFTRQLKEHIGAG